MTTTISYQRKLKWMCKCGRTRENDKRNAHNIIRATRDTRHRRAVWHWRRRGRPSKPNRSVGRLFSSLFAVFVVFPFLPLQSFPLPAMYGGQREREWERKHNNNTDITANRRKRVCCIPPISVRRTVLGHARQRILRCERSYNFSMYPHACCFRGHRLLSIIFFSLD